MTTRDEHAGTVRVRDTGCGSCGSSGRRHGSGQRSTAPPGSSGTATELFRPGPDAASGGRRPARHRRLVLGLVTLSAVLLSGCWDLEEIDRRTPVLGITFDAADRGGWRMAATIPDPRALVPAGGTVIGPQPQEPAFVVLETEGPSASETLNNLREITSRDLFLGQVMVIGASERLARQGLGPLLEFLMNNTDIPRATWFVITAGPPGKILGVKPPQQTFPEFYLDNVFRAGSKAAGTLALPYWRLWVMSLRQGQDALVPVAEPGPQQQIRVARAAALRGDRLAGVLSPRETRLVAMLRGARNVMWEVRLEDGRTFTFRTTQARTTLLPLANPSGGPPRFRFQVEMHVVLDEAHEFNPSDWAHLEQAARRHVAASITRLVHKLQGWQSDIWGFGERYRVTDPQRFAAAPWPEQWQRAHVEVVVQVRMVRGGAFH